MKDSLNNSPLPTPLLTPDESRIPLSRVCRIGVALSVAALSLFALLVANVVHGQEVVPPAERASATNTDAGGRGLALFQEADRRQSGFGDMLVDVTMVLRNRRGKAVERELELKQLEVPEGGDKLMVVFQTPKAIRGTALLSHGQLTREDDQWLYLPALKRVKKIASRNRSGPFLGSEFSYEDLSSQEVTKYSYRYLREEACGETQCYVIERRPGPVLYSGYLRQVFWLDTEHYRTLKVDYYNRGDRLTKTLIASEFERFANGIWKPRRMQMSNLVTGKSTDLLWRDFEFGVGLSADRDLSTTSLLRVR